MLTRRRRLQRGPWKRTASQAPRPASLMQMARRRPSKRRKARAVRHPRSTQSTTEQNRTTTGQGAAGSAKLTTEQRTKITSVIKSQKVEPVRLNVSVSVGTRIPADVRLHSLPQEVIVIYPEWRGYDYILVGDQ